MLDVEQFWSLLASVIVGALGYLSTIFWFRPILRYRDIKYQVASELVFYANAIDLQTLQGEIRQDTLDRKESNRRRAADLAAIYSELRAWYKCWLNIRKEDPPSASAELIGLSNTSERQEAKEYIQNVKRFLRLALQRP